MNPLIATIRRELQRLVSRKAYIFAFFVVPLGCTLFFLSLMDQGLPLHVPTAIVDQDHSAMSREITRTLNANSLVTITRAEETYSDAVAAVRCGQVYGFFVIPKDFEADAVAGRTPVIDYYSNMTYYVPGTFLFKGFKTTSVTSAAGMMRASLTASGMEADQAMNLVQPMTIETHAPGNPWTNYSMYLTPSFMMTMLALMVLLVTAFSITQEIKWRSSPEWLETAGGSITIAVFGKLLPHTVLFTLTGWAMGAIIFGFGGFPLQGPIWALMLGLLLMVVANQALAVFITSLLPNPRLALSICALLGILSFSIAGLSFPVESMYGGIAVLSYIVPVRYMFLLYVNIGFNGLPLYYSRWMFVILAIFPALAAMTMWRLKKACLKPVYVP